MRARLALLLAVAATLACGGCARRPNVLVVLVDTLRFDRLGAYGSTRGLTPFMDSLAARGVVFRRAYAQSSWTNPSVASLFTSRYQSQDGMISFGSVLPEDELTLAEVLRQHGFRTGAFIGNVLVSRQNGFAQGFDEFDDVFPATPAAGGGRIGKGRAEDINPRALAWVDRALGTAPAAPVFLYVHYMEPHAPYAPPPAVLTRMLDGRPAPDTAQVNARMILPFPPFEDDFVADVSALYDAEVTSLDAGLRELFAGLEARHFLDHAIVVLLADHGEELREHGLIGHHQTLYDEVIRVPLVFLVPGRGGRTDVDDLAAVTDVAPTLLSLLGISRPASFEGRALATVSDAGWWRPAALWQRWTGAPARPVFAQLIKAQQTLRLSPHESAVVDGSGKLIVGVGGEREYYDVRTDPGERDAAALAPATRAALDRTLATFAERVGTARGAAPPIDPQTRDRMRALGYVE